MRFVSYDYDGKTRVGLIDASGTAIYDLTKHLPDDASTMLQLISLGQNVINKIAQISRSNTPDVAMSDVRILAPIPLPQRNIFCVGKNYRDHLKEVQSVVASKNQKDDAEPEVPIFFTKATTSVIAPNTQIDASADPTDSVDYEGELGVIIGRECRRVNRTEAMNVIFGYTIINDITSRRLQKQHQQWFLGKSLDSFCPMGPTIVTRDEIADLAQVQIKTWVNEELRQDGNAADMIFGIPVLIETLSRYLTLQPGDIIATGTPAGVGMGFRPPRFLKRGDRVKIIIEPIGVLENSVA